MGAGRPPPRRPARGRAPVLRDRGVHFWQTQSYVDHDEPLASPDIVSFNHGLAQIITAVLDAGLTLTGIEEHDTVPWNPLDEAMELVDGSEYRLRRNPKRLAATYTLQAEKRR